MNIELFLYFEILSSIFVIRYSTCPPMPHTNKGYIRRKLIVVTIKQHKPNGLWQAGILFYISSETPSRLPLRGGGNVARRMACCTALIQNNKLTAVELDSGSAPR
jgi:hypothetical protein